MKTKYITSFALVLITTISYQILTESNSLHSRSTGAPAGHSGDPASGNKTCNTAGCHTGPTPVSISGLVSSNVPAAGYTPGSTYTITAAITRSGHTKFGFQATPQNASGTLLGSLIATSAQTQIVGATSNYITHTSSGTSGNGSKTWTFNWTAPTAGTGNVTFYAAFNATNSNSSSSGDSIFTSNLLIPENTTLSAKTVSTDESKLQVFPNPVSDKLNISFATSENQEIEILICDLQGKISDKIFSGISKNKEFSTSIDLNNNYPKGVYLLKLREGANQTVKKIIIE